MSQDCKKCDKLLELEKKVLRLEKQIFDSKKICLKKILYLEKQVFSLNKMVLRKEPTSSKIERIASAVIGGVLTYLINLLISKLIN